MTTNMRYLIPLLSLAVLASCGGGAQTKTSTSNDSAQVDAHEAVRRIRAQEDSLFAKSVFDRKGAMALQDVYLAFAKNNPLDSMAPEYLFRAAGVSRNLGDPKKTLTYYDRIIKDYPGWKRLADTYYLRAFTIDSDLGQKGEAKTAYEEVIHRFPDHKFASDAKQMIENLQYTDEQLIEKFKKMNEGSAKAEAGTGQ
jgi:TolA-binding protein